jgi:hypothetical protein
MATSAAVSPVAPIIVSVTVFEGISILLGVLGVILARLVYVDAENKKLGRRQTVRETMPLTMVALLIAGPFIWKHRDAITVTPLLGLGIGWSALLLLKLAGTAVAAGGRAFVGELARTIGADTAPIRKHDPEMDASIARLDDVDDSPGPKV